MRERKTDILTEKLRVLRIDHRCVQQARELSDVIVRQELRGVLVQESRGGENIKPFVAIEAKNAADALQHVAAHAAVARFQPAQGAVVDLRQVRDLLLRQTTFVSEARQQTS